MTRDYAKKRKPRRQTRRQGAPGWLWLAAGLAVGLYYGKRLGRRKVRYDVYF